MIKAQPLVSVIMNCYNGERFLKDAIDSVFSQTYQNWEIIFWDNASTDQSSYIAQSYDSRLKYFKAQETTPLGQARELAVTKAKGKYLTFLDCDDLWLPEKLALQISKFNNNKSELAMVYGRCEYFYSDCNKSSFLLRKNQDLPEGNIFKDLSKENFIPFLSVMIVREIFIKCGGFPQHLKHSPDYWLFMHVAYLYPVGVIQDVCCKYRIHNNNLSNSLPLTAAKESIEILSKFLPNKYAEEGLRHQKVKIVFVNIKKKYFLKAFTYGFKERILWLTVGYLIKNTILRLR